VFFYIFIYVRFIDLDNTQDVIVPQGASTNIIIQKHVTSMHKYAHTDRYVEVCYLHLENNTEAHENEE